MHALVAEAMRKTPIAWISVDGAPAYPAWCLWIEDALYVISAAAGEDAGEDADDDQREQPAPGLAEATSAIVTARGDHGGRIVEWRADASRVPPDGEAWAVIAPQLAGKRLNAHGSVQTLTQRWSTTAVITKLAPADDDVLPADDWSGAAPPRETPASRRAAAPFRLHRVKKARR